MKIFLPVLFLVFSLQSFAQEISGRAFYTSMYKFDEPDFDAEQLQDPRTQALAEQLKQGFQDQYQLDFTQEESLFKKLPKLDKPDPKKGQISVSMSVVGDDEILYKNLSKNQIRNETELYGKKFLIQDKLESKDWKLSKESRTIGDYVCFKATYVPTSDDSEKADEKEKTEVIAWYTPQIPIKNGPKEYDGLPGLILEVQEGNLKFLCTKIVLNPQEAVQIIEPSKGKKVSQKEFDSILDKKNEEMMESFQNKKSRD